MDGLRRRLRISIGTDDQGSIRPADRSVGRSSSGRVQARANTRVRGSALALTACLWSMPAMGQQTDPLWSNPNPASTYDISGTTAPYRPERRLFDPFFSVFQTERQQHILSAYQTFNRRLNQRGLLTDRATTYGLDPVPIGFAASGAPEPFQLSTVMSLGRRSHLGAGGLLGLVGESNRRAAFGAIPAGRSALLLSTSLNAPLYRAFAATAGVVPTTDVSSRNRMLHTAGASAEDGAQSDRMVIPTLQNAVTANHRSVHNDAWAWFAERDYLRAVRAFDAAVLLDRNDHDARIGRVCCLVRLGRYRTASIALARLLRREPNPFARELDVRRRIDDEETVTTIRRRCADHAQRHPDAVESAALDAFILWFLGDPDEAIRTARAAAAMPGGAEYAPWPAWMNAARAKRASGGSAATSR